MARKLSEIMKEMSETLLRNRGGVPSSEAAHVALYLANVAWNESVGLDQARAYFHLPAATPLSLKLETGPLPASPEPVPRRTFCPGCGTRDRVATFMVTVVLEVTTAPCGRAT
jgi:hypothetical protein